VEVGELADIPLALVTPQGYLVDHVGDPPPAGGVVNPDVEFMTDSVKDGLAENRWHGVTNEDVAVIG
jgi:hypothetical protein